MTARLGLALLALLMVPLPAAAAEATTVDIAYLAFSPKRTTPSSMLEPPPAASCTRTSG
jgi:hypothetical protein